MKKPDRVYFARKRRTEILLKKVEEEIDVMIEMLIPEWYVVEIKECDTPVPGYPHSRNYTHVGHFKGKPGADVPHWVVHSYSVPGVKAKLLSMMFEGKPVSPLT